MWAPGVQPGPPHKVLLRVRFSVKKHKSDFIHAQDERDYETERKKFTQKSQISLNLL